MGFQVDLHGHLAGDGTLWGLVPDRIQPVVRKFGAALPAITYQVVAFVPNNALAGTTDAGGHYRVQLDCWAISYNAAMALAAALKARMNTAAASFRSVLNLEQDLFEEQSKTYRVLLDFSCWYQAS